MAKKAKKGKNRLDKFYHLAKEQGYRSRAAFKLIQLNKKYNFLADCRSVLDLCAAPGGWLQVCAKTLPVSSLIVGVDLCPIKPIRGVKCLIGDITTQQCRAMLRKEANGSLMDVVLHDGAPNVGGAWSAEAYSQSALVLESLKLATEFLVPKGTFVTKVFRSQDYTALLYAFNQLFAKVEATKPTASRGTSAEIFVVCMGYKAPAKIDPRLLDPKHLFQEVTETKKIMGPEALIRQKVKQQRHREGYEEGISSTFKVSSALAFVASDSPVEVLGTYTQLALDGPSSWSPIEGVDEVKELAAKVREHPETNAEIKDLLKDLQVLGRAEFKQLLKWRMVVRKSMKEQLGADKDEEKKKGAKKGDKKEGEGEGEDEDGEPLDPEEKMLKEMSDIKAKMEQRQKREKKKRREMKKKAKVRSAQQLQSAGVGQEGGPEELFALKEVNGVTKVAAMSAPSAADMEVLEAGSDEDDDSGSDSGDDSDDGLAYEAEVDAAMEESYKQFLLRKGHRDDALREKRKRLGMDGELEGGDADADVDVMSSEDIEEYGRLSDEEADEDGLLVELDETRAGVAKSGSAMASQWFGQDLFEDANLVDDEHDGRKSKRARNETKTAKAASKPKPSSDDDDDEDEQSDEEEEEAHVKKKAKSTGGKSVSAAVAALKKSNKASDKGDFEVVPQGGNKSSGSDSESDSEDEFDDLDDHAKAEVLALAKRMLRRKEKESIMDAAYNRFAFHDTQLPRWFEEDERRHMRPIMQVTKEEVDEEKQRLRAIDARPIKKVVEAKARKAKRILVKLQEARTKANAVADQEDVPMKSKMREIGKIYAKAQSSVARSKKPSNRKGPPIDGPRKKEMRAEKRRTKAQKGRKGGKGGGKGGKRF